MRSVPNIKFYLDNSLNEGIRMSRLVDDAIAKDQAKTHHDIDVEQTTGVEDQSSTDEQSNSGKEE